MAAGDFNPTLVLAAETIIIINFSDQLSWCCQQLSNSV